MAPQREVGLDPLLERDCAELLEPCDLGLGERLVEEVGERRPAPERERVTERTLGRSGVSALEFRPSVLGRRAKRLRSMRSGASSSP